MNNEDIIWDVVNHQFCSYKVKTDTQKFCRNEYNVTGLCNRTSCPLANNRYATVREIEGSIYLFVKTVERAHSPAKLWEKIKLDKNLANAIEQIDKELIYWPNKMINKCKLRLTRIKQYLIKMRKLKLKNQPKLTAINKKVDRREKKRESKALVAAKLENSIEKELLNRLLTKAYGEEPLNVNEAVWNKILEGEKMELEDEITDEDEEEEDEEEREFVEGLSESDEELEDLFSRGNMDNASDDDSEEESEISSDEDIELDDNEDKSSDDEDSDEDKKSIKKSKENSKKHKLEETKKNKKNKKKRGAYVEIEYEHESANRN